MIQQYIDIILKEIAKFIETGSYDIWQATFGKLDPFWGLALEGALIIAACFAAGWFFSILRPVAGAIAATAVAFLVGYWKGENAEHTRDTKKKK